jgi:hypothetical protein
VAAATERLEVGGNVKLSGAGSALIFPDGTSMTTAAAGGAAPTGTGIVAAINDPATAGVINDNRLSPNFARLNAANAFVGSNTFSGNQSVTGNVSATGTLSGGGLAVDANTLFVDAANNRVGVGTAEPQQALSVGGSLVVDQASTNAGTITSGGITFGNASGEGIGSKRTVGGNQAGLDFYTNFANRMTITNAGRVGVGTTTPAAVLDILGGANHDGVGDPFALAFQWGGGGYRHWVRTRHSGIATTGNAIDFFVNSSTTAAGSAGPGVGSLHTMTLNGGRVGIGTQSPSFKLHVSDSGISGLRVESATAGGTVASFGGNGDFRIDTSVISGGRLMVKENGNVGIGKNSPTQKLDVAGNAAVSGSLTAGSVSSGAGISAIGSVTATSLHTTGSVVAANVVFPDGTIQGTAVGNTFSSFRTDSLQLPPSGQGETSFAHLDVPAGNFQITATFTLENQANIAFQNNARQVVCSLNGDAYEVTLMAPALNGKTSNTLTLHSFRTGAAASGVDLSCRATTGGTDRSYVYIVTRRVTANRMNDFTLQP